MGSKIILVILGVLFYKDVGAQRACRFTTQKIPTSNETYVENFSAGMCLRVEALGLLKDSKVVLGDCTYGKSPYTADQKFSLVKSSLGQTLLKSTATKDSLCLTVKNGVLHSSMCQSSSFDHNWTLKHLRDNGNQYLIEHYGTMKCLVPKSRERGSVIKLLPCNSLQTEQIWKICAK